MKERRYIGDRQGLLNEASANQKIQDITQTLKNMGYKTVTVGGSNTAFAIRRGFLISADQDGLWIINDATGFHVLVDWDDINLNSVDIRPNGKISIRIARSGSEISFY